VFTGLSSGFDARNYFGFDGWKGVAENFCADLGAEPEFVYAIYNQPAYEGRVDVVYCRDGKWWHVSGGHCSSYGLDNQWEPQETDPRDHFLALSQGKRILDVSDSEGEFPTATSAAFDAWLRWAFSAASSEST